MLDDADPTFLNEVIDLYLITTPALFHDIRHAVAQQHTEGLVLAAHSLKSSSANFGAATLSSLAHQLELLGRAGTLSEADELVARTQAEFGRVQAALQGLRR